MTQSRILPLLGPAAVLYLLADIASVRGGLSPSGVVLAAAAVLLSLAPYFTRIRLEIHGTRRVAALGVFAGLGVLGAVDPGSGSMTVGSLARLGAVMSGALVVDLAITVPRGWAPRFPRRLVRSVLVGGAVASLAAGVLALAPVFELGGRVWVFPARAARAPYLFAVGAAVAALVVRLWRRRSSDDPLALASNTWAVMGLVPASLALLFAVELSPAQPSAGWVRVLAGVAAVIGVAGHVALVDPRRRLHAGRTSRRASSALLTAAVLAVGTGLLQPLVPHDALGLALAAAVVLVLAVPVYRVLAPAVRFVLAPARGRLLGAIAQAEEAIGDVSTMEGLARATLGPLRDAARRPDAMPLLYTVHPAFELRIDAAREPHVRERPMPATLQERLLEYPGEVVVRGALEGHVVRRPALRPLVDALCDVDALCAVPLLVEGELEGVLVVPRGRRGSLPTLEEMSALRHLANRLAALVVLLLAQERARVRTGEAMRERDLAEERIEALEDEVARLRAEAGAMRAGRGASRMLAPQVAYAEAMRAFEARVERVAPMDAPVLLVAEGGTPVDQVARWIHARSGRADGPFVVADCASVRPEQTLAALLGSEGDTTERGWLQLAAGGTVLLADAPALSPEAQAALGEALGAKCAVAVGGAGTYPVDVRVVATSRLDLRPLVRGGAFDPELGRWLGKLELRVPALRSRKEDIPSLALLALDRSCRVLGREPMGMEQEALDVLLAHDWPGNQRELQHVIDRAVARASGPKVGRDDLPPLMPPEPTEDPLVGTYAELEKRILAKALERAGGNKSQAARALGLKRTTFLDKLRRHDLDGDEESNLTTAP